MTQTTQQQSPAEEYRSELVGFCYRFLGSWSEAEDAVQETMLRAWQRADTFEGRSSLRTWVYRIATNICLDLAKAPQRRALPVDLTSAGQAPDDPSALRTLPESTWVSPFADHRLPTPADPATVAEQRESVRLAFIAALQTLPPKQRAVLILRDVLGWSAAECAELLGLSVASVNSALARSRASCAAADRTRALPTPTEEADLRLLSSYLAAFERYDIEALVALLTQDAEFSMPPYSLWMQGTDAIRAWWDGPGRICEGSRCLVTRANGRPAMAVYHAVATDRWLPFAIHVLDVRDGAISAITHFMDTTAFAQFGLPPELRSE
ncbi:MAG: sigma-70 family RNA polymerase sigma factor [Nakamurella sp.]